MSTVLRSRIFNILALLIIPIALSFSQDERTIDSLRKELVKHQGEDSLVSAIYHAIANIEKLVDSKQALKDINLSISHYKRFKNEVAPRRYLLKVTVLRNLGQIDSAIYYCNEVVNYTLNKDKMVVFLNDAYGELGLIAISQGNFTRAIEYFNKQLTLIKSKKIIGANPADIYNNMGIAYASKGELDLALEYFKRGLQNDIVNNRIMNIGNSYNNIGILFNMQGRLDSAEKYYRIGLDYRKQINDKIGICGSLNNFALLYKGKKKYKKALEIADSAFKLATDEGYKKLQQEIYSTYTEIYTEMGDYKSAFEYFRKSISLRDFFYNEESKNKIDKLERNLEIQQKNAELLEKDLQIEKAEKQKQKQAGIILLGAIFMLALSLFLYVFFRNNKKLKSLNQTISFQKNLIEEKHKDIRDSITYAHRIQSALIPSIESIKKTLPGISILYKPRDIVSGDFYWYARSGNKHVFVLADCTGHGVPGAFMSIIGMNHLHSIVNQQKILEPAIILNKLREGVVSSLNQDAGGADKKDGMDLVLLIIEEYSLNYAAANQSVYLLRDNQLREFKGNKQPVGLSEKTEEFTSGRIELMKNDRVILFTDGIPDQFGGQEGKKLKSKIFKNWLTETASFSREEQMAEIENRFHGHMKNFEQTDDISLAIIEIV